MAVAARRARKRNRIHRAGGARAIAVDVLFLEQDTREGFMYGEDRWSGDQSDSELVRAVRGAGNVVLLADAILADERVVEAQPSWPGMLGFGPEDGPWQTEPRPTLTRRFLGWRRPRQAWATTTCRSTRTARGAAGRRSCSSRPRLAVARPGSRDGRGEIKPEELKINEHGIVVRDRQVRILRERVARLGRRRRGGHGPFADQFPAARRFSRMADLRRCSSRMPSTT